MKTLPNGVVIFNATPHVIRFWDPDWPEPVEVPTDKVISAKVEEVEFDGLTVLKPYYGLELVMTRFVATPEGRKIIGMVRRKHVAIIVGSIIAAQAYPFDVVAMVPCDGHERVPPTEKRVRPDKFTIFPN